MNQLDLHGRVAVITGGAQGIGYAVAERMMASGAKVALWDIQAERLEQARQSLGPPERVFAQIVDVTDERSVAQATQATAQRFDRIDALVSSRCSRSRAPRPHNRRSAPPTTARAR